jgi:hypothetical protein
MKRIGGVAFFCSVALTVSWFFRFDSRTAEAMGHSEIIEYLAAMRLALTHVKDADHDARRYLLI